MNYKEHIYCRACGNDGLIQYLDLGLMPLANNLTDSASSSMEVGRLPLEVLYCTDCMLSQLSVVVDPGVLFSDYNYRSSVNKGYIEHCRLMALYLESKYNLDEKSFHIDIAGNDGTLLYEFKKILNHNVLNIDPAGNLFKYCYEKGVPHWPLFWNKTTAEMVLTRFLGESKSGNIYGDPKADLITATNVFAHVDDVKEFLESCKMVLKSMGIIVIEFPYLLDFLEKEEFDTVYFEHLSYFNIRSLYELCKKIDLTISCVEKQDIHGGTVRVTISKLPYSDESVNTFLKLEDDFNLIEKYRKYENKVRLKIDILRNSLRTLKRKNKKVAGFAASAKGNTLLNAAGVTSEDVSYIVDETPEKIGKYSPGTGIQIVDMSELEKNPPDYLLILSWNFKKEIIEKVSKIYKGKYIIPIPEFKVI